MEMGAQIFFVEELLSEELDLSQDLDLSESLDESVMDEKD